MYYSNLGYPLGRHLGLQVAISIRWTLSNEIETNHVVKDPTKVFFVGEYIRLMRQRGSSRFNLRATRYQKRSSPKLRGRRTDIHTRQSILSCYLLRSQMLLDRQWVVRATLDCRVIDDNDTLSA